MKLCRFAAALLACVLLASCAPEGGREHQTTLLAMDTVMSITAYGPEGERAVAAAADRIRELEGLLSVTDESSEIYAANNSGGGTVTVSDDTAAVIARALELCADTGGALDVTVYPVVREWGFTTGDYRVPEGETLAGLLERVDFSQVALEGNDLTVPDGTELDLGAVAKGWAGEQAAELLTQAGVTSAKLELGGNVQVLGAKPDGSPWRVGVRAPTGEGYVGILEVVDKAVVTSGGYERYFERDGITYWHIIDPADGRPADSGLISVTIVADDGATADGLSTALFVMGEERASDYWRTRRDFDFIAVGEDGAVIVTPGLTECFSLYGDWTGHTLRVVE